MILDERLTAFVEWCAAFQLRIAATLEAGLVIAPAAIMGEASRSTSRGIAMTGVPEAIDVLLDSARHATSLRRRTKPELARLRSHLEQFETELQAAPGFATFVEALTQRIAELPLHIDLRPQPSRLERARGKDTAVSIPLRAWLEISLARPVIDVLATLDAETILAVDAGIAELDRLDKVTDYYVLAVPTSNGGFGD